MAALPRSLSSNDLRREIGQRNIVRAAACEHELSYSSVPSVVYQEADGSHGNFHPSSYRAICANQDWRKRLQKAYTGSRWISRAWERKRRELECANSSDALLMNIFCYPKALSRPALCNLLGVEGGLSPEFGFRPQVPLNNGRFDRTEVDMRLGDVLFEAKLTETGFQTAPLRLLLRYRDFEEVFDTDELPRQTEKVRGYQLIRGILAAYASDRSYVLLCDVRRADLMEQWFSVLRAVRSYSFRSRLRVLNWQDLTVALPARLRTFLESKYGISA
ncbi:MAG TPA: hypothetical protein VF214_03180 [Edaphobacter sp.]